MLKSRGALFFVLFLWLTKPIRFLCRNPHSSAIFCGVHRESINSLNICCCGAFSHWILFLSVFIVSTFFLSLFIIAFFRICVALHFFSVYFADWLTGSIDSGKEKRRFLRSERERQRRAQYIYSIWCYRIRLLVCRIVLQLQFISMWLPIVYEKTIKANML